MPKSATPKEKAVKKLTEAVKFINKSQFEQAKEALNVIINQHSEVNDVAERAKVYLKIVTKLTDRKSVRPTKPEEKYLSAMEHLNNGDLKEAEKLLKNAAGKTWKGEQLYLMALIKIADEELDEGLDFLKKAIAKDPSTRVLAYNCPDLAHLHNNEKFKELLNIE